MTFSVIFLYERDAVHNWNNNIQGNTQQYTITEQVAGCVTQLKMQETHKTNSQN